ncbi:HTH domain-containing protein [Halalkalicoccus ordinarius]|uniref:HTH domain-containing protein n=1 Tax=Halalkalicoccus ordinarius TaxID=3116651 RepID=UPI00300ED330
MTTSQLRATLKLRSFPRHGITDVQRRTLARLHRIADVGTLTTIDVDVWGSHAVADSMTDHECAASTETVSDFERWAESHGYTLAPAFAYRESRSMIDDETREVTVVPLVTLAVYEGDRLEAVYPHADGDRVRTVDDGIETLEAMAPPSDRRSDDPARERDPSENRGERLLVASNR